MHERHSRSLSPGLTSVYRVDLHQSEANWTRGEIRADNNYAGWYELRCHQTLLRRIHYVGFNDRKKDMVAPDRTAIGRGRLYYCAVDSVDYAVQRFWTARKDQDYSRGLRIRGDGETAREARSRWPSGIDIPVLEPGELDAFLEIMPGRAVNAPEAATDPIEQYELFLRILLDLDDWRRSRGR